MIAAQRTLFIAPDKGGAVVAVPVTIDVPVLDRDAWVCTFRIGWPDGEAVNKGMGFDGMQALESALRTIAIHLYASPQHHAGKLYFDEPGRGYGFPLPAGGRDLAIGDDRKL